MSIADWIRSWRLRRTLAKYITPKSASRILRSFESRGAPPPETKHFQFIVVHIRDTDDAETPRIISSVVDTLISGQSTLDNITSSLVVALMGVPYPEYDSSQARLDLVEALLRENGKAIRIAHGECNGLVGLFGGKARFHWGACIPEFSKVLSTLLNLEFGTALEFKSK